jgi:hypothetical protein
MSSICALSFKLKKNVDRTKFHTSNENKNCYGQQCHRLPFNTMHCNKSNEPTSCQININDKFMLLKATTMPILVDIKKLSTLVDVKEP